MGTRGFIITIDSFLGIVLLFMLVIVSFSFLSNIGLSAWNNIDAHNAVNDEAIVLEKSLALENAVKQSSSEALSSALNSTRGAYCFDVTILNPSDYSPVVHALKSGCASSSDSEIVSNRSFAVRTDSNISFYIAKVGGWAK